MSHTEPESPVEPPSAPDARVDSPSGAGVDFPFDADVDARGMACPLPILKAKKALSTLTSGQVLRVLATDPGSKRDFEAFARQTGNAIVHQSAVDGLFSFHLKRR